VCRTDRSGTITGSWTHQILNQVAECAHPMFGLPANPRLLVPLPQAASASLVTSVAPPSPPRQFGTPPDTRHSGELPSRSLDEPCLDVTQRTSSSAATEFAAPPPATRRRLWLVGRCLALLAVVLLVVPAPASPPFGHEIRSWTTDEGLPHNAVTRALQDSAGFLWFGTVGGLARFDGREIRNVPLSPEHPEQPHNVRGLAEESPGVLVVLASPGRLVRIAQGTVTLHPANAHLNRLRDTPVDLYVEPAGAVWVATTAGSLLRWTPDGSVELFGLETPVAARSKRFSFVTDAKGETWIASDDFLAVHRDGRFLRHPDTPAGPGLLAPSRRGGAWYATTNRLFLLRDGQLLLQTTEVPWKDDFGSVRHLAENASGELLLTGRRGLVRYQNRSFETLPLPSSSLNYILEDREKNLWVCTIGSGIGQLRERSHRVINEEAGLRHGSVSSLAEDSTGRIWIANRNGGLHVLDPKTGRAHRLPDPATQRPVDVVAVDRKDQVWFGGPQLNLWPAPSSPDRVAVRLAVPADNLNALLATRSGAVWFATTDEQIGRYQNGQVELLGRHHGYSLGSAYALVEDRDGALWIGGRTGILLRWDGSNFHRVGERQIQAAIHDLNLDQDGYLWIGTASGLLVRDGDRIHRLTTDQGLPDNLIYNVLDDDQGQLWLATRRGLFHAPQAELLAVARNGQPRLTMRRLGPEQGLRGFTPTPNFEPNAIRTVSGRLLFATTQGVIEVDPTRVPAPFPPPPVLVDTLRWNGEPQAIRPSRSVRLPSGEHRVDLGLAVLSFAAPESILLRHRLVNFDAQWVETGSDRVATYTNLPPGRYELLAVARNAAGVWSEAAPLLTLHVEPTWWETTGFRIAAAVVVAFLIAAVARAVSQRRLRARLRRLEEAHALERERNRIARDLHDELGAGMTEVGLLADRLVESAPREMAAQLTGLAWRSRRLATDLSGIVWTMNSSHSSLHDLATFLRRYAERLFRHSGVRIVVSGVESVPTVPLPPDVQHQLLASTKEALNNIIKHAQAIEARMTLLSRGNEFEVQISDNGVGYSAEHAQAAEGNGLRNMRTRLEECGGTCTFVSHPGQGTTVTFRLPLQHGAPDL
jgi:signal transduction histidine kinase/ligand-binding sensor domain-containing protein